MKTKLFLFLQILLFKFTLGIYNSGENWAILACGSTGYINYRHQADVFHVYQTLIQRGFSKNHIILFAYDDIAYHKSNPFPGEIYNRPDGPNVYEGVIIDYSYNFVTPENYISVLKGDTQNGHLKKVLNSTKNDNIFLYFSDHGINGAMVFPDNKFLYADELEETFRYMQKKEMYKNIIFYMESCYSGSMFDDINLDLNVYSITAASPHEQSMATYCYPDDNVKGQKMHTCLSNEFTSNWLDDTDNRRFLEIKELNDIMNYSSHEQYLKIKDLTKNSHVGEYGNLNVGDLPITFFQSSNDSFSYDDDKEKDDDKKEKSKEEIEYDEIIDRIKELDDDDDYDEYEDEDVFNSIDNLNDELKEIIKSIDIFNEENDNYNFINYIIDRNKFYKRQKHDEEKQINKEVININNIKLKRAKRKSKKNNTNIPSQNVRLYYLQLEKQKNPEKVKEYEKELEETEKSKIIFQLLKMRLNIPPIIEQKKKINFECLRYSIQIFKNECNLNERDLLFISSLSDICTIENINLDLIKESIIDICKSFINKNDTIN